MACLPPAVAQSEQSTYRSITIDGEEVEFSGGFTDLHTEIYRGVMEGRGFGLDAARPSIELAHDIRVSQPVGVNDKTHDFLARR